MAAWTSGCWPDGRSPRPATLQNASGLTTVPIGNSSSVMVGNAVVAMGSVEGRGTITAKPGQVTTLNQTITASDDGGSTASETVTWVSPSGQRTTSSLHLTAGPPQGPPRPPRVASDQVPDGGANGYGPQRRSEAVLDDQPTGTRTAGMYGSHTSRSAQTLGWRSPLRVSVIVGPWASSTTVAPLCSLMYRSVGCPTS